MLLVLVLRVALNFIEFVDAERVAVGVVTMVIVDQDRLGCERVQHEGEEHAQRCGKAPDSPDQTNWHVPAPSDH